MVLSKFRKNAGNMLLPITRRFSHIHPNTFTWLSLIFAIISGVTIYFLYAWPYFFFFALTAGVLSSLCDLLDGDIARLTGKSSRVGDFLDHSIDRYSDLLMVFGIIFSPLCSIHWGVLAVSGMLMVSYMGTQAQALNVKRIYGGLLGRADRLVVLGIFSIIQFVILVTNPDWTLSHSFTIASKEIFLVKDGQLLGMYPFTIAMVYFAVAGHYTALYRAVKTYKVLGEEERAEKKKKNRTNSKKANRKK